LIAGGARPYLDWKGAADPPRRVCARESYDRWRKASDFSAPRCGCGRVVRCFRGRGSIRRAAELFNCPARRFLTWCASRRAALDNPNLAARRRPAGVLPTSSCAPSPCRTRSTLPGLQPEEKRDLGLALDAGDSGGAALGPERQRMRAALAAA
jgi:hypothetical protein